MRGVAACAALTLLAHPVLAQARPDARSLLTPVITIGSVAEEQARLDQLRGRVSSTGWLVRTAASMSDTLTGWVFAIPGLCEARVGAVPVAATTTWNSDIPFERNDGGVWAGRGLTGVVSAGARARCGRVTMQAIPEVWRAANRAFYVLPSGYWRRSDFASPFHSIDQSSADLPVRFGVRPVTGIQPGQSAVTVDLGRASVGVSTESEWWGPGIRNALVLSNNAAGIPRWFVGTTRPLRTRAGALSARLISGILTESRYFDRLEIGTQRPLSGAIVTLATATDSNLSIGVARVVYQRRAKSSVLPLNALDVLTVWSTRTPGDSAEQLTSLFGRWVFPRSGVELYGEWARVLLPTSLRDVLVSPQHSQGYTAGLQWLSDSAVARGAWRAHVEFTNLEQLRRVREESPPSFYTSPVVPQGYTQRGQVIGATIGPGSSSQFIGVDRVASGWSAGAFGGRIRWDHDEFYPRPSGLSFYAHDVSVYWGLRGTRRTGWFDFGAELVAETRMNYLFQHANYGFGNDDTFDVHNVSLRFSMAPRPSAR